MESLYEIMKKSNIVGTVLKVPIPFYLTNKPFEDFEDPDYSWETDKCMTLIVRAEEDKARVAVRAKIEDDNIEVEGQPLEYPFDPNEDFEAAIKAYAPERLFKGLDYSGIPMNNIAVSHANARSMVVKVNRRIAHDEDLRNIVREPMYVATNMPEKKRVKSKSSGDMNAAVALVGCCTDHFSSSFSVLGPDAEAEDFPIEDYVMDNHWFQSLTPDAALLENEVHAIYEKIHGEFVSEGKVYIEFLWSGADELFQPPPEDAEVKLGIKPRGGDASPSLKKLWEEVELLNRLMQILKTYSKTNLHQSTHQDATKASWISEFPNDLNVLMTQQSKPVLKKDSDFTDSLENNLAHAVKGERNNIDFTDQLWKLITDKNADLTFIYNCVYSILRDVECKNYRPHTLPGNETLLDDLIQRLVNMKLANFRAVYSPAFALQMAIDCGLNKLFRDYAFVLKMCHLIDTPELGGFKPDHSNLEASLTSIKKLHCLLEILSLIKERVGISMGWLETYARRAKAYLLKNDLDWDHVYHFKVRMHDLKVVMEGLRPIYWNLRLESVCNFRSSRTNVIFSRDFYLGHVMKLFSKDGTIKDGYYIYIHNTILSTDHKSSPGYYLSQFASNTNGEQEEQ